MTISIITPSFNQATYLEQTIDSILSQGYENLEYIIIDGGSEDSSVDIIKKYKKHLKYWVSEADRGQSHAINKGLKHATGEIVNWINSDDFLEPNSLKRLSEAFEDPSVNVLCGRSNIVKNGRVVKKSNGTDIYKGNLAKTIGLARIDQPETWFRSQVFNQITPLREDYHFIMDKYLWVRYLLLFGLNDIVQTNEILVNFRHHEESKTVSKHDSFINETIYMYAELAKLIGDDKIFETLCSLNKESEIDRSKLKIDTNVKEIHDALHYFLIWLSDYYYASKSYRESRKIFKEVRKSSLSLSDHLWYKKLGWSIPLKLNRFKSSA